MTRRSLFAGLLLVLPIAATTAAADIYSFTDENGVTHFTNVPSDARFQVLLRSAPEVSQAGARISPAMLARSVEFDEIIDTAAKQTSVEASLLRAVIVVESAFNPDAVSIKGARGLMQLMPATARAYGATDVDDPAQNVHAGARYLRDLIGRYKNDLELVLAAYNAGETAVEKHGRRIPPFAETRDYIPRVLRVYNSLRELSIDT